MEKQCPICKSNNLIDCPKELKFALPNTSIYDVENEIWKRIIEYKMCSDCKYIMSFYIGDERK